MEPLYQTCVILQPIFNISMFYQGTTSRIVILLISIQIKSKCHWYTIKTCLTISIFPLGTNLTVCPNTIEQKLYILTDEQKCTKLYKIKTTK